MSNLRVAVFLAASITACGTSEADRADQRAPLPIAVAVVNGEPGVLFNPESGLSVGIRRVVYDDFGRVRSYDVDFARATGDTIRARILAADTASASDARRFVAYVGGDTLHAVPSDSVTFAAALVPKEPGGVQLKAADSLVTNLDSDSFGRQQVASQEFNLGSVRWKATFSGQTRDGFGRFETLHVRFDKVP